MSRILHSLRSLWTFDRPGVEIRLRLRQPLAPLCFLLALLWQLARPSGATLLILVTLGLFLTGCYLWARAMARSVSARRRVHYPAVQVGDEFEEQITLQNDSWLSVLWAEFSDRSDLPGYTVTSARAADGNETITWRSRTTCTRRGLFMLGPWELRLGDPFALFEVRQTTLDKSELLVYPPLAPLPARLVRRGQAQGEQRTLQQPLAAETQLAFSARPYLPGDPLRHLHWPTTARHEAPYVKVFEPESSSTIWLVADMDQLSAISFQLSAAESREWRTESGTPKSPEAAEAATTRKSLQPSAFSNQLEAVEAATTSPKNPNSEVQNPKSPDSPLEFMCILLASLAAHLLNERMAVGLLAYSGRGLTGSEGTPPEPLSVLPGRGPLHLWPILRTLAVLQPAKGRPFGATLRKARALMSSRDLLLAVTPSLDPAWLEALPLFSRSHARSAAQVLLIDPASFDPQSSPPGAATTFVSLLARQGVRADILRRGELRPILGSYGALSRWEFQTLATGRVFVRRAPRGGRISNFGIRNSDFLEAAEAATTSPGNPISETRHPKSSAAEAATTSPDNSKFDIRNSQSDIQHPKSTEGE